MAENKTKPTNADVAACIAAVEAMITDSVTRMQDMYAWWEK